MLWTYLLIISFQSVYAMGITSDERRVHVDHKRDDLRQVLSTGKQCCCRHARRMQWMYFHTGTAVGWKWLAKKLNWQPRMGSGAVMHPYSFVDSGVIILNEPIDPFLFFGWLLSKKATRVEVNISLAFLHWVGVALHPWPFDCDIAIFVLNIFQLTSYYVSSGTQSMLNW